MSQVARVFSLMVIDDDEIDRMLYARVVAASGVVSPLTQFSLATEAMQYLRQPNRPPVDLIALDINMPIMSGYDFLEAATQEFGEEFAKAVIIMLTTAISPEEIARAQSFSVVKGFAKKPITVETLQSWSTAALA